MRNLLLTVLLSVITFFAFSQTEPNKERKFTLSAGLRFAIPLRDLKTTHTLGVGADVQGELRFAPFFTGVLGAAIIHFPRKKPNPFNRSSATVIPLQIGMRIYPVPVFFFGGKAGMAAGSFYAGSYGPEIGINLPRLQFIAGYIVIYQTDYRRNHGGLSVLYKFR